ncbi:TrmH family RNA methyltransferase [Pectinatus haikarae]|uniref:TrmH family RNA methyltransferase n=1 Tax=Pectinatus haikarae TaxID=349096 RepID=A0ABT9Y4D6_9FIRM|nr:RNA methyltransferase [Pectinatus haikarae]MDQ0202682.1 TrmH family RNA methyltransferase [Pectinatus haikarae]
MPVITSTDNIQIKKAAALKQKKYREKEKLFLIEGIRLIEAALLSAQITECFFTAEAAANKRCATLINILRDRDCLLYEVSSNVFLKLADTDSPQGIVATAVKKDFLLDDLSKENKKSPIYIILDKLQDPGNAGTIIRTAEASGIDGIIAMQGTVDIYSSKVVRATMGAAFHLPIVQKINVNDLRRFITENNICLFSTVLSSDAHPCYSVNYNKPAAIILGNEGDGVSNELLALSHEHIYIPMYGKSESLNASSAAAMIMYEIMRQRQFN